MRKKARAVRAFQKRRWGAAYGQERRAMRPERFRKDLRRRTRRPPPKKELSRKCRSPLLFHPPLRQGGDLRPFAAFPERSEIGGMASTETDPESFFESVGKSTGVAHTTG